MPNFVPLAESLPLVSCAVFDSGRYSVSESHVCASVCQAENILTFGDFLEVPRMMGFPLALSLMRTANLMNLGHAGERGWRVVVQDAKLNSIAQKLKI